MVAVVVAAVAGVAAPAEVAVMAVSKEEGVEQWVR